MSRIIPPYCSFGGFALTGGQVPTANLTWLRLINQKRGIQVLILRTNQLQTIYSDSTRRKIQVAQLDISDEWIPMWGWSIGCISTTKICKMSFFQIVTPFPTSPKNSGGFHQPIFSSVRSRLCSLSPARNCVVRGENDSHLMDQKHPPIPMVTGHGDRHLQIYCVTCGNRFAEVEKKHTSCTYWMAGYYLDIPTWKLPRRFHLRKKKREPNGCRRSWDSSLRSSESAAIKFHWDMNRLINQQQL